MYKEDQNVEQEVKNAISKVIDQWVNDLITKKIVTTTISPKYQRGLWDRLKGSLSNLWHGRYSQSNPNYWKNRFGDELGSQVESYDPRIFTLHEFKEIKQAIEEAESLVENIQPDTEKLKIVRVIRSAAEELKQKLFSIFAQSCDPNNASPSSASVQQAQNTEVDKGSPEDPVVAAPSGDPLKFVGDKSVKEKDRSEIEDAIDEPTDEPILPKDLYDRIKPIPENEGKSLTRLENNPIRLVDILNHKDLTKEQAKDIFRSKEKRDRVKKLLDELLHDALIPTKERPAEDEEFIMKVERAIKKMKEISNELD